MDPTLLALLSDFAGSAGAPFPSGWQDGPWSGESGWQLDGAGAIKTSAAGFRDAQTATTHTRAATPGGIRIELSVIPTSGTFFLFLTTANEGAGGVDGYAIRWSRAGADFQLQSYTDGASAFLAGQDEVNITGTIADGLQMALLWDSTPRVEGFVSTDGGSTWQSIGSTANNTFTGAGRGGIEGDSTTTRITNAWFGAQVTPSLSPPPPRRGRRFLPLIVR